MANNEACNDATDVPASVVQGSDELCDLFCESCENVGTLVPARGYCVNCGEYFCATCCLNHRKFNITKNHVIRENADMPSDQERLSINYKTNVENLFVDKCLPHNGEFIKFYCKKCDEVGCSVCVTTSHINCGNVDYIPDVINVKDINKELVELSRDVDQVLVELDDEGGETEEAKELIDRYKERAFCDIEKERKKVDIYFDKIEQSIRNEVTYIMDKDKQNVNKASMVQKELVQELRSVKVSLQDKTQLGSPIQQFIATKHTKQVHNAFHQKLKRILVRSELKVQRYSFQSSPEIMPALENITKLGSIVLNDSRLRTTSLAADINIASEQDESRGCSIQGIELISENRILVSDSYNYAVKLISVNENKVASSLKMQSWPFALTSVGSGRVATTLPALGIVQFFSVHEDDSLTKDNHIELEKTCCGVTYSRGKLIVTYSHPKIKLEILDLFGRVLQSFSRGANDLPLFDRPFYVAKSPDHEVIYVSDIQRNTVTCLQTDGTVLAVVRYTEHLKSIRGVTVDADGIVYACALNSQTVCQLTGRAMISRPLLDTSDGIASPQALAFCKKTDRLFVGMDEGTCVKVFNVCCK